VPVDPELYRYLTRADQPFGGNPPPVGPGLFGFNPTSSQPSPFNAMAQTVIPMLADQFRGQVGGFGFTFDGSRSLFDAYMAREYLASTQRARAFAAPGDTAQVTQVLRGMAALSGHQVDAQGRLPGDVEAAVGRMAGRFEPMLPILAAAFPDAMDNALPRGSFTAAAGSFVAGSRYLYDSASGGFGVADSGRLASSVLNRLLPDGGDRRATAGLGAGRVGEMFDELSRRGMFSAGGSPESLANGVADTLKSYTGAVSAIRDIFGDAGRPNAPMRELFAGLSALSGGGVGLLDPGVLSTTTRQLQQAARMTGLGLGGVTQLSAQASGLLDQYGASGLLAAPLSLSGAAMAQAYVARGFGAQADPSLMTRGQFTSAAMRLGAAGAGSEFGNLVGAALVQAQFVGPGTPMARLAEALQRGQTSVEVNGRTVDLSAEAGSGLLAVAQASGIDPGVMQAQLLAGAANQQQLARTPGALRAVTQGGQQAELLRAFAMIASQAGAADPAAAAQALLAGTTTATNDIDLARRVAGQIGVDPGRLAASLGQLSELSGGLYPSATAAGRLLSPDTLGSAGAAADEFRHMANLQSALAGVGREPLLAKVLGAVQQQAQSGAQVDLAAVLGGLGMFTDEQVKQLLSTLPADTQAYIRNRPAALSGLPGLTGPNPLGTAAGLSGLIGGPALSFMAPGVAQDMGGGGATTADAGAAGTAVPVRLQGGQINLKIDVLRLEVDGEGRASLKGAGSAVGTQGGL
jgi:hypothetical protein